MTSVQLVAYVPLLFVAAAFSAGLAVYTWRNRDAPGAAPLTGMLVGMTAWAGFYGVGLLTQSVGLRVLWLRLNWMGSGLVPAFWLLFATEYSGHDEWIRPSSVAALVAVPVLTVLLAWTTGFHDLMWTGIRVEDLGAVTILRYEDGPWQAVFEVYTYLVIAVATVLLGQMVLRHRDMYTDQAVALILGSFMPAVGYLVSALGFSAPGVDLTPLTFPVTGALFAFVIFRGDLFEALSTTAAVGQDTAVEAMQDAVLVTDESGTVIETNPSAATLLGVDAVGQPLADLPALGGVPLDDTERTVEVTTDDNRALEVTVTPIEDVHDRVVGHGLVARDITARRNARQRIQITNRVLRHNLRNDMTVVVGNAEAIRARTDEQTVAELADNIVEAADALTASGTKARQVEELLGGNPDPDIVDLTVAVQQSVGEVRADYPAATITVDSPDSANAVALDGIGAAVTETLENAVVHSESAPTIDVVLTVDADAVCLTVTDDGPGIPDHECEVVFEDDGESPLSHASGTGLWLVKWLVERSGGTVSVEPTDQGTTVTMRFERASETATP